MWDHKYVKWCLLICRRRFLFMFKFILKKNILNQRSPNRKTAISQACFHHNKRIFFSVFESFEGVCSSHICLLIFTSADRVLPNKWVKVKMSEGQRKFRTKPLLIIMRWSDCLTVPSFYQYIINWFEKKVRGSTMVNHFSGHLTRITWYDVRLDCLYYAAVASGSEVICIWSIPALPS